MDTFSVALDWANQGIAVIPCQVKSKIPALKWVKYQTQLPSYHELVRWFKPFHGPAKNLAVVTGWRGLVVLDFDNLDAFFMWQQLYPLKTYMVLTARGVHVYIRSREAANSARVEGLGDIKAGGGYVLAPPSVHPSGAVYQVLTDYSILEVENLKEIFPAGLLEKPKAVSETKPGFSVKEQFTPGATPPDPWQAAMTPTMYQKDLVTHIREKISILDFFPTAQAKDRRWWITTCPFHDDHKPSFWIDTQRQVCGCYAGCTHKPLDVINVYARLSGLTNSESIKSLQRLL